MWSGTPGSGTGESNLFTEVVGLWSPGGDNRDCALCNLHSDLIALELAAEVLLYTDRVLLCLRPVGRKELNSSVPESANETFAYSSVPLPSCIEAFAASVVQSVYFFVAGATLLRIVAVVLPPF